MMSPARYRRPWPASRRRNVLHQDAANFRRPTWPRRSGSRCRWRCQERLWHLAVLISQIHDRRARLIDGEPYRVEPSLARDGELIPTPRRGRLRAGLRVAWIDGGVGLNEILMLLAAARKPGGRVLGNHDAGRDGEGEALPSGFLMAAPIRPRASRRYCRGRRRSERASILSTATSVFGSVPITLALNSRRSSSRTVTCSAPSTT